MTRRVPRLRLTGLAVAGIIGAGCQSTTPPGTPLFSEASLFAGPTPLPATPIDSPTPVVQPVSHPTPIVSESSLPRELNKVSLPPYTVETPDVLRIDVPRMIPLPPYRVLPLDALYVFLPGVEPGQGGSPVTGVYPISPEGTVNLGADYGGPVGVADLTVPEVEEILKKRLEVVFKPEVARRLVVSLAQASGMQRIAGPHPVRPDGTVHLGQYGTIYVAGLTLPQIKMTVEAHLAQYLYRPEASVDVHAYRSKFYYVITDVAGRGEAVVKLPATGNETVLDAVANAGCLSVMADKRVWVARPGPAGCGDQILPVDWKAVSRRGATATNYQVLPGDRVFVMGRPASRRAGTLARVTACLERVFGTDRLGFTAPCSFDDGGGGAIVETGPTVTVER
ncbi:MAG: polysaccharide biosynthesis/export family protein [Gemmataceae bacterium]